MTPPTQLEVFGRLVWKLAVVILLALAAMAVLGLIVRVVFGLDSTEIG